ncbi:FAD-dependent oxidoreductase [Actinomycetospora sp. TBRC 11914]|uniref:FAD-dependent oxidoreductase n=1 Tax=Actinomycetospora sp. TBRC 11914 TaxID=2729387 RepID=UPI00145EB10D|nr:FAD-dependent oxidoreductase [Actinomycetospora sp. TBRC 11914]NMO91784.1 FAD-dependent oxidoreductase [Actinomycetospora sp. TBRC 11914]
MPRPVILTVDDDPGVSRAVARDLRREYGEHHRIVRADSGEAALEALREIALRGEQVAVILADQRMPRMSGVEFLEQAMDIFPRARRVLLTAYADTEAAITAINVVDLDHYLLKPWDPPEEKLYPVVDQLLETWRRTPDRPATETRIIGHRWSARSYELRDLLARNQVPFRFHLADDPEGHRLLEAAGLDGARLPVVVTGEGTALVDPTDAQVAEEAGLATHAVDALYDLAVVGGGPGGLGAAVYGGSEGLRTVLVESVATGGQAGTSSRIENYLGFPDGVSGAQLTDRARRQAVKFGVEILTTRTVTGLAGRGGVRVLTFDDGSEIAAHAVVLATGVSYRTLSAPGLTELAGLGVYYGAATTEAPSCAGETVYVVGGANSAGQAAMNFSRYAQRVVMLVRGPSLQASMSQYLIEQIEAVDHIEVRTCTEVVAASGEEHLEKLTLRDRDTGDEQVVDAHWLFVFIGAEPRTDWLDGVVVRDDHGFVLSGPDLPPAPDSRVPSGWEPERDPFHLETSLPGVFAVGDVRGGSVKRVASAVGEGAMAVSLVHRWLENR